MDRLREGKAPGVNLARELDANTGSRATKPVSIPGSVPAKHNVLSREELARREKMYDEYYRSNGISPRKRVEIPDAGEGEDLVPLFRERKGPSGVLNLGTGTATEKKAPENDRYGFSKNNALEEVPYVSALEDPDWTTFTSQEYVSETGRPTWGPKISQFACNGNNQKPVDIATAIISSAGGKRVAPEKLATRNQTRPLPNRPGHAAGEDHRGWDDGHDDDDDHEDPADEDCFPRL